MKDGLSHDVVLSLLHDSQGFLWVGTRSGLNKFDGYQFKSYRPESSKATSLSHSTVLCMWEDPGQRIWIGTAKGLNLFHPQTEKFTHIPLDTINELDITVGKIQERKNGMVWICTNRGVFEANPQTMVITKPFDTPPDEIEKKGAWDIAETKDGVVWVSTGHGILKWDGPGNQPIRYLYDLDQPYDQNHKAIYVDNMDRIWVGGSQSLDLFNPETEKFTRFIPETVQPESKIDFHLILETTNGNLLVAGLGLDLFDPQTGRFEKILEPAVWSLLQDRQDNLWVGTFKGLYQIASKKQKFKIVQEFGPTKVFDVRVTTKDSSDNIWVVAHNPNELFRFDPFSRFFTRYSHDPKNPRSFSGDPVYGIVPSNDGGVWIASYYSLEKFNHQDQSFSQTALPFDPTWLMIDSETTLWIGGYGQFGKYNMNTKSFEPIKEYRQQTTRIVEDANKNIWLGTYEGLYRYSLVTRELKAFSHNPQDRESLSHNLIFDIRIDSQGTIWVGTLEGLNKMLPDTESQQPIFRRWNTSNSDLPFDNVSGIVPGADGTLWLSSGNQVSHFNPGNGTFRNYDQHDGLHGGGISRGLMTPTGEIFLSSRDGMVVFHPDSLQDNDYIPPVEITGITINNQPVSIAGSRVEPTSRKSPLKNAINYTETIELSYHQRDFSLEFAALNYVNPENNHYKYKLEPYESDWIETTAENRTARYTNISPGKYTFRVIGSNNDGLWNEEGRTLAITINPPLWATWYAYAFYALCALCLVLGLRHYEKKRFILKQQAKSLKEIDRAKSEFFTNISHELRTPLTLILGPLKAIQQDTYQGDRDSLFTMMSQNGRRLLQLVNQLLDLSKLDQGKLDLKLQDCHLNELVQQVLANFDSACTLKELRLEYQDSPEPIFCKIDIEKMRQVLYNLVSNAIKFTPENGHIQVSVKSAGPVRHGLALPAGQQQQGNPSRVKIVVKDSGIGIPKEELDHIFDRFYQVKNTNRDESEGTGIGLALAKKLVELHKGTIEVESEPGWGSTFTITLPLSKAEKESPAVVDPAPAIDPDPEAKSIDIAPVDAPWALAVRHTPTFAKASAGRHTQTSHPTPTLLLVEDNSQMRQYIKACLGQAYHYLEAANGEEGLQLAHKEVPDLILCDVMMPKIDGFEFCSKLRDQQPAAHIPFIFLTARADLDSRLQGLGLGSSDYVTKPFDDKELRLKVRNHLEKMQQYRTFFAKQLAVNGDIELVESLDDAFLNKAVAAVNEKISVSEFSVQDFSRTVGFSHTQLYRKLLTLTGLSPSAFIRSIRLKKAAQLIVQNYGNTSEVAYAVGFNNLSYFTKCFKEQFGVVPSAYGKKHISD